MFEDRPWLEVAKFCAMTCQAKAMQLKVWELPVASYRNHDPNKNYRVGGEAVKLLRQMRASGMSLRAHRLTNCFQIF